MAYAGLAPTTYSSGEKTYHGKLLPQCNGWLRWAFVEAAWVAIGCDAYFGTLYRRAREQSGHGANTAIIIVARRMAEIAWQLLSKNRRYEPRSPSAPGLQNFKRKTGARIDSAQRARSAQPPTEATPSTNTFPARSRISLAVS